MIEASIFERLLDLSEEWRVTEVVLEKETNTLYVYISYTLARAIHPVTGEDCKIYDLRREREWQHLPVMQYRCFIRCRVPRVKSSAGRVASLSVPWAESGERHTYLFENLTIDVLQATHNQTKAAGLLNTSFDIVNRIMHRSVARGLARRVIEDNEVTELCLDEKAFSCPSGYISVLVDPANRRILDVAEGRDTASALQLLAGALSAYQLAGVKNVNMDMWKPYMTSAETLMPQADITHDKFHVVKYLNDAVDSTRKQEVKTEPLLRNSKYTLLKNACNRTPDQHEMFSDIMEASLKTSKAWAFADSFKEIFSARNEAQAQAYLDFWADKVMESKLTHMVRVAKTMVNHAKGIINNIKFRTTNSLAERFNGKIQTLNDVGRGYRTFKNFRSAILFFNGALDLLSYNSL